MMTPLERAKEALGAVTIKHDQGASSVAGYCDDAEITDMVNAVLQAIREPSEAMLVAAEAIDFIGPGENDAAGEWRAMVDAAIKEARNDAT